MFRSKIVPIAMATVIAAGGAGAVLAPSKTKEASERQEIAAVISAKTSLAQAIAAAEQRAGGKAFSDELEAQNGVMAYKVKVSSGDKLQKVLVDPETGKVTKTMVTKANDHEDNEHDED